MRRPSLPRLRPSRPFQSLTISRPPLPPYLAAPYLPHLPSSLSAEDLQIIEDYKSIAWIGRLSPRQLWRARQDVLCQIDRNATEAALNKVQEDSELLRSEYEALREEVAELKEDVTLFWGTISEFRDKYLMVKHWVLSRAVGMYLVTNFGESSEGKKERERRKEQAAAELVMLENNLDAAMREGKLAEVLELRTAILRAKVKLGKASFPLLNVRSAGRHRLKKTELMDAGEAHATAFELSQVAWRELQLHEQAYLPATSAVPPKVSNIDILETFDRQRRDLHHLDRNTAMEFLVVMQVGIYSVGESDIFLLDSYPTTHNIWANVPFPALRASRGEAWRMLA